MLGVVQERGWLLVSGCRVEGRGNYISECSRVQWDTVDIYNGLNPHPSPSPVMMLRLLILESTTQPADSWQYLPLPVTSAREDMLGNDISLPKRPNFKLTPFECVKNIMHINLQ